MGCISGMDSGRQRLLDQQTVLLQEVLSRNGEGLRQLSEVCQKCQSALDGFFCQFQRIIENREGIEDLLVDLDYSVVSRDVYKDELEKVYSIFALVLRHEDVISSKNGASCTLDDGSSEVSELSAIAQQIIKVSSVQIIGISLEERKDLGEGFEEVHAKISHLKETEEGGGSKEFRRFFAYYTIVTAWQHFILELHEGNSLVSHEGLFDRHKLSDTQGC